MAIAPNLPEMDKPNVALKIEFDLEFNRERQTAQYRHRWLSYLASFGVSYCRTFGQIGTDARPLVLIPADANLTDLAKCVGI
jgi:hypothetical protein